MATRGTSCFDTKSMAINLVCFSGRDVAEPFLIIKNLDLLTLLVLRKLNVSLSSLFRLVSFFFFAGKNKKSLC